LHHVALVVLLVLGAFLLGLLTCRRGRIDRRRDRIERRYQRNRRKGGAI
jgi:hypothetical protein